MYTELSSKDTLQIRFRNKKRVKMLSYDLISLIVFSGVIFILYELGYSKTKQPRFSEIAKTTKATPESTRGSTTLKEISTAFFIPLDKLYKALSLDIKKSPPTMKFKDIKSKIGGFDTEKVREVMKKMVGGH